MKTKRVDKLLGKEIFVIAVKGVTKERATSSSYFYECVGTPALNKEPDDVKYYDYMIYYPSLGNSFLMHGKTLITYITKETNPEYFL